MDDQRSRISITIDYHIKIYHYHFIAIICVVFVAHQLVGLDLCKLTVRYYHTGASVTCLYLYLLKFEASVRLCALWSQRALTIYTQRQTALLRPMYPMSAVVGS